MLAFSFVSALTGLAALALAMDKHHRALCGGPPSLRRRWTARTVGTGLLLISVATAIAAEGLAFGLTWWAGLAACGAMAVLLFLSFYEPQA